MARGLLRVMTHGDAVVLFETQIAPMLPKRHDGTNDELALSEAWNNWTDSLCKSRQISDWQYENWSHPPSCGD